MLLFHSYNAAEISATVYFNMFSITNNVAHRRTFGWPWTHVVALGQHYHITIAAFSFWGNDNGVTFLWCMMSIIWRFSCTSHCQQILNGAWFVVFSFVWVHVNCIYILITPHRKRLQKYLGRNHKVYTLVDLKNWWTESCVYSMGLLPDT